MDGCTWVEGCVNDGVVVWEGEDLFGAGAEAGEEG